MIPSLPARGAAALVLTLSLAAAGCGGDAASGDAGAVPVADGASAGLSAVELEQGIGPVRDLELGALDPALAERGEQAFVTKCSACHKLDERYVGPRLGTVLARRSPEFVLNMIVNAGEMVEKHPVVREMLAQFYTPMPVQVTDPHEARAILEYLRSVQTDSASTPAVVGGA